MNKSARLLGLDEVARLAPTPDQDVLTGAQVKEALEHGVSRYPADVGIDDALAAWIRRGKNLHSFGDRILHGTAQKGS